MTSENNGQTAIEAYFERLLSAAFAREAKGESGKTPDQVRELMKTHAAHMNNIETTYEREAELVQIVSDLDLDSIQDRSIRIANAKMAESQQQKLTDVEAIKAFTFTGYRNANPEDPAAAPGENGDDAAGGPQSQPPPAPSGP